MNWFSANLRYLRRSAGMRQSDLADRLGYKSFTTIQKWESGVAKPGIDTVEKLARLFRVRIDELLSADLSRPNSGENDASSARCAATPAAAGTDLFAAAERIQDYQICPEAGAQPGGCEPDGAESPESFD